METFAAKKTTKENISAPVKNARPFFQAKLTVNVPGDQYEQEADSVADQVMRMPDPAVADRGAFRTVPISSLQRKCSACEHKEEKIQRKEEDEPDSPVQMKAANRENPVMRKCADCEKEEKISRKTENNDDGGMAAPDIVSDVISSSGKSLDPQTQDFMGNRMGQDFSDVQIHTDSKAAESASSINALAYTSGNHIVFNSGQYQPGTDSGKRLLAHELTHVGQQSGSIGRKPFVQRFIYWSAIAKDSFGRAENGKTAETEVINKLRESDAEIKTQRLIPNASRESVGLGEVGLADIFKGSNSFPIFYNKPTFSGCPQLPQVGTPHVLANKTDQRRKATKQEVSGFLSTPLLPITLGEVKPASDDMVHFGKRQLDNYEEGIRLAVDHTNCWAAKNELTGHLDKGTMSRIAPPIPTEFTYNAASPKTDRELGVFDFNGIPEDGGKVTNKKPRSVKTVIRGGLYFKDMGHGVIVYFYRPANIKQVYDNLITNTQTTEFKAYMSFATELQDKVINPLTKAPEKVVAKKLKPSAEKRVKRAVQRKSPKKRVEMKDDFNLDAWKQSHQQHQDKFNAKDKGSSDKRDELEFMELIHDAEQYKNQPVGHGTALTPHQINVSKPGEKPVLKDVSDLFGWGRLWAREPMKYLGTLRKKFGGTFVKLSKAFDWIKTKIGNLLGKSEEKNAKGGTSWGAIAIKAFWKALTQLGGLVMHETGNLLVESLHSGLKKKLGEYIPTDKDALLKLAEKEIPYFTEIEATLQSLEDKFSSKVEPIVNKFNQYLDTFHQISETFQTYGTIIKWANAALQCGTPPGFGCLKLLATALAQEAVNRILQWCWTQKKFASLLKDISAIRNIPKKIAGFVAESVNSILPDPFRPIFDSAVFDTEVSYDVDDIPCGDEVTETHVAMVEFQETLANKIGFDNYQKLCDALAKYGVKPNHELTAKEIRDMAKQIPDNLNGLELDAYLQKGEPNVMKEGEKLSIAQFLQNVESNYQKEIAGSEPGGTGKEGSTASGSGGSASESEGGTPAALGHDLVKNEKLEVGTRLDQVKSAISISKKLMARLSKSKQIENERFKARVFFQSSNSKETTAWIDTEFIITGFTGSGENKILNYTFDPAIHLEKFGITIKSTTGKSLKKFKVN